MRLGAAHIQDLVMKKAGRGQGRFLPSCQTALQLQKLPEFSSWNGTEYGSRGLSGEWGEGRGGLLCMYKYEEREDRKVSDPAEIRTKVPLGNSFPTPVFLASFSALPCSNTNH